LLAFGLFGLALGLAPCHRAVAQEWPNRPPTMIVPFPAGAAADTLARAVANAPQTSNSYRRAHTGLSAGRPRRGDAFIKASAAVGVFPGRLGQDFADTSVPVTSTTSPSRMGFAIPKKRATTAELL